MAEDMTIGKEDYESFQEVFRAFTQELRQTIDSLKSVRSESVSLRDERTGFICDMSSSSIPAGDLLDLCGRGVTFLRDNQTQKEMTGVN